MGTKPRLFDPEFKAETVGLVREQGRTLAAFSATGTAYGRIGGGSTPGAIAGLGLPRFSSSMVAGATTLEETR